MNKKDLSKVVNETALIIGFTDINEVASHVSSSGHNVLLDGYLLYAYKGDGCIKSIVISTGSSWGKLRLSVVYDSYKMLFSGFQYNKMDEFLLEFSDDKKLKIILESLVDRFYEN